MKDINDIIDASKEAKRAIVVKMVKLNFYREDIMLLLNISNSFISKWLHEYDNNGTANFPLGYKGSESYLSLDERANIIKHIQTLKGIATKDLVAYIKQHYKIEYKSLQSYYDIITEAGYTWHKTAKSNPAKNEEAVLTKREELKKNRKS